MHNMNNASDSRLLSRLFFRLLPIQILLLLITTVNNIISSLFASNYIGTEAMSAIALYAPVSLLLDAVSTMFVGGSQILCGKYMGKNQMENTQRIFSTDLVITAVLMALAVPLTRLFYRDAADPVYQMTVAGFRILPLCMPLSIICMQFTCYAQASGKQLLLHILTALDGVVCVAGFTALLIPSMGINGVYIAEVLNSVVCALAVIVYSWIVRRAFPRNMEQLMVIPDDFGVEDDARIDITVRSIDEVSTFSQQVIDFCRRRGINERIALLSGLFLEEMAGNVVAHGFNKDGKPHSVDVCVVHKGDDVILRIKDDCIPFDPAERQEIADPKDPLKGAGIRMVYRSAKDIQYQNILGLNVLTIRT